MAVIITLISTLIILIAIRRLEQLVMGLPAQFAKDFVEVEGSKQNPPKKDKMLKVQ